MTMTSAPSPDPKTATATGPVVGTPGPAPDPVTKTVPAVFDTATVPVPPNTPPPVPGTGLSTVTTPPAATGAPFGRLAGWVGALTVPVGLVWLWTISPWLVVGVLGGLLLLGLLIARLLRGSNRRKRAIRLSFGRPSRQQTPGHGAGQRSSPSGGRGRGNPIGRALGRAGRAVTGRGGSRQGSGGTGRGRSGSSGAGRGRGGAGSGARGALGRLGRGLGMGRSGVQRGTGAGRSSGSGRAGRGAGRRSGASRGTSGSRTGGRMGRLLGRGPAGGRGHGRGGTQPASRGRGSGLRGRLGRLTQPRSSRTQHGASGQRPGTGRGLRDRLHRFGSHRDTPRGDRSASRHLTRLAHALAAANLARNRWTGPRHDTRRDRHRRRQGPNQHHPQGRWARHNTASKTDPKTTKTTPPTKAAPDARPLSAAEEAALMSANHLLADDEGFPLYPAPPTPPRSGPVSATAATAAARKVDPADLRTSIRTANRMGDAARAAAARQHQRAEEFRAESRALADKEGMGAVAQQAAHEAANLEQAAQINLGRAGGYANWAATLTRLLGA